MSKLDDDATALQRRKISQLCIALGITELMEEKPMTKGEAGRLVRQLSNDLKLKRSRR